MSSLGAGEGMGEGVGVGSSELTTLVGNTEFTANAGNLKRDKKKTIHAITIGKRSIICAVVPRSQTLLGNLLGLATRDYQIMQ